MAKPKKAEHVSQEMERIAAAVPPPPARPVLGLEPGKKYGWALEGAQRPLVGQSMAGERLEMGRHDPINHPSHYAWHPVAECIDIAEEFNFNLGNVLKYVFRAGKKDPDAIQDLEKAQVYLKREIARIKRRG